jgi:hypothetical protein
MQNKMNFLNIIYSECLSHLGLILAETYAVSSDSHNLYEATGIFVSTKGQGAIRNDMNKRG